jgi:hypothetical protein
MADLNSGQILSFNLLCDIDVYNVDTIECAERTDIIVKPFKCLQA